MRSSGYMKNIYSFWYLLLPFKKLYDMYKSPNVKVKNPQSLEMTYNMEVNTTTLIRCYLQSVDLDTQKILQQYCLNIERQLKKVDTLYFLSLVTTCSFSTYSAAPQKHPASLNINRIHPSGYYL